VYRWEFLSQPTSRLRGKLIPFRRSAEAISLVERERGADGYAAFNTSLLVMDNGGEYLAATRISNGRFGRISDWKAIKSFTGVAGYRVSPSGEAVPTRPWALLELAGAEGLKSYRHGTLEDLRLFRWGQQIHATANLQLETNGALVFRPCVISLVVGPTAIAVRDCVVLDAGNGVDDPWAAEKNWYPLVDDDTGDLYLMRYFQPRHLYRYDPTERRGTKAHVEEGDPNTQYRSPSAPIQVTFRGRPCYLGISHSRSRRPRNYEYATTYLLRFYLLETTFPFKLLKMTKPVYFDFLPQGFLYPFQIAATSLQADMDSIVLSTNLHDSETLLFKVPLSQIFDDLSWTNAPSAGAAAGDRPFDG